MAGTRVRFFIVLGVVAFLVGLLFSGGTSTRASWYDVGDYVKLICDAEIEPGVPLNIPSCTGTNPYAPGETADYLNQFSIPVPSSNFSDATLQFIPPDSDQTPGEEMPIAAFLGAVDSTTILGLTNFACNPINELGVYFAFYNGNVDTTQTFYVDPDNLSVPTDDAECYTGAAGNGIPNHVDCYPGFLNGVLDPDFVSLGDDGKYGTADDINGPLKPLIPRVRMTGFTVVAGTNVILQFVIFNPGQLQEFPSPHPFSQFGPEFGYPTLIMLQNPLIPLAPGSITDFCAPLSTSIALFGKTQECEDAPEQKYDSDDNGTLDTPQMDCPDGVTEGGYVRSMNPPAGTGLRTSDGTGTDTHLYSYTTASFRDADNDGVESEVDTCVGTEGNPNTINQEDFRLDTGPDGDMWDSACDTTPTTLPDLTFGDHDLDGYVNAQDMCPGSLNGNFCYGPQVDVIDGCVDVDGDGEAGGCPDEDDDGTYWDVDEEVAIIDGCVDLDADGEAGGCPDVGDNGTLRKNTMLNYDVINGCVDIDDDTNPCEAGTDDDGFLSGCQWESEFDTPFADAAPDGGPRGDGMSDDCDPQPTISNGHFHTVMSIYPVTIGPDADDPPDGPDNDTDGDGWSDAYEDFVAGTDPTTKNSNPSGDHDGDGIPNDGPAAGINKCTGGATADCDDNCPIDYNPDQADTDSDAIGDVCELLWADPSGVVGNYDRMPSPPYYDDTALNANDNCPYWPVPQSVDADGDGIGDYCDPMVYYDFSPFGRPEHRSLDFFAGNPDELWESNATPPHAGPGTTGVDETCDDGLDNDGDTDIDGADSGCGDGAGDADDDGILDGDDNCPSVRNQTQTDTDADNDGDACDDDDDDDGYTDKLEWWSGTDPLAVPTGPCDGTTDRAEGHPNTDGHDKGDGCDPDDDDDGWEDTSEGALFGDPDPLDPAETPEVCDGLDNDGDTVADNGLPADCRDDGSDADGDGTGNLTDTNDDSWEGSWRDDMFSDAHEEYMGTDKDVTCSVYLGPDNDPFDIFVDGQCNVFDTMEYMLALGSEVLKDQPYDRRVDLFVGDPPGPPHLGKINVFDTMQFYAVIETWQVQALGNKCPYDVETNP